MGIVYCHNNSYNKHKENHDRVEGSCTSDTLLVPLLQPMITTNKEYERFHIKAHHKLHAPFNWLLRKELRMLARVSSC